MARKVVAGNWKMNTYISDGVNLANKIKNSDFSKDVDVILAAPYTHLYALQREIVSYPIFIAAQNCHSHEFGAFTGEISPLMLRELGVTHVIIGHSERRSYFKESAEFLKDKMNGALKVGLVPIFCCGEDLNARNENKQEEIVGDQLNSSLFKLSKDQIKKCIIAYEPVWAIGTGVTASPEQAQEMHGFIRNKVRDHYGENISNDISILYGGSVKPSNAAELFSKKDVDGGLVGGASLKAEDFVAIINSF